MASGFLSFEGVWDGGVAGDQVLQVEMCVQLEASMISPEDEHCCEVLRIMKIPES